MSDVSKMTAPLIDNKVPAFIWEVDSDNKKGKMKLSIPFQIPRSVASDQIGEIQIFIKTTNTGAGRLEASTSNIDFNNLIVNYENNELSDTLFTKGQFYKIQIAFKSKTEGKIGYYSNAAIIKCTSEPQVEIKGLDGNNTNRLIKNIYTGTYKNLDSSEKVYSYRFDLYDKNENLLKTSGEQLHNNLNDIDFNKNGSQDSWDLEEILSEGEYSIKYSITTINGLKVSSSNYKLAIYPGIETQTINIKTVAENDYENGCINIYLQGTSENALLVLNKTLLLTRKNNNTEIEITKFELSNWRCHKSCGPQFLCRDFSVKQGEEYTYLLRIINDNNFSEPVGDNGTLNDNSVKCDFEDAFLFDGEHQLCIRYNPKIASFKSTLLESKTDTLGGKYPFIFRNGNVRYKEFSISGLISILSDENKLFQNENKNMFLDRFGINDDIRAVKDFKTALTTDNIHDEREFKMNVLSWLTNGKPKMFKSATEGNFIIRLMNSSLSPNDTLGRMLHTFTSTAYEINDYTYDNLFDYGFTVSKDIGTLSSPTIESDIIIQNISYSDEDIAGLINNTKEIDIMNIISNELKKQLNVNSQQDCIPGEFYFIKINRRPLTTIYLKNDTYYSDKECTSYFLIPDSTPLNRSTIYLIEEYKIIENESDEEIEDTNENIEQVDNIEQGEFILSYFIDGCDNEKTRQSIYDLDYKYLIKGIDKNSRGLTLDRVVYQSNYYHPLPDFESISKFYIGNGLQARIICQAKVITYKN